MYLILTRKKKFCKMSEEKGQTKVLFITKQMSRVMIHPSGGSPFKGKGKISVVLQQPTDKGTEYLTPESIPSIPIQERRLSSANGNVDLCLETALKGNQHLFIKQAVVAAEFFLNAANKYEILNSSGDRLLLVAETTDLFTRICYGGWQPFQLSVYRARPLITLDPNPKEQRKEKFIEVLRFEGSPGACGNMGYINVTDGKKALGSVQQIRKYSRAQYSVRNSAGNEILQIKGPEMCMCCISCLSCKSMTGHVEFDIYNPVDNANVGRIAKQWSGIAREVFTKADIWGLKYAPDMNLDTKSVLLAAVFLIDFQYFER